MNLLILFSLFVSVSAIANPNSEPLRIQDPSKYGEMVWDFMSEINRKFHHRNWIVPVKVLYAEEKSYKNQINLIAIVGESVCGTNFAPGHVKAVKCEVKPDAKLLVLKMAQWTEQVQARSMKFILRIRQKLELVSEVEQNEQYPLVLEFSGTTTEAPFYKSFNPKDPDQDENEMDS